MERDPQRYHSDLFRQLIVPDQAKKGWGALYVTYRDVLERYLARKFIRYDQKAVEDIVADVFLALWIQRDEVAKLKIAKDWLFKTAANKAKTFHMRMQLGRLEDLDHSIDHSDDFRGDLALEREEEKQLVREALARLPPRVREVVEKKYMDGIRNREIAEGLGLSPQTVGNQANDGINRMKKDLNLLDWLHGKDAPENRDSKKNQQDD